MAAACNSQTQQPSTTPTSQVTPSPVGRGPDPSTLAPSPAPTSSTPDDTINVALETQDTSTLGTVLTGSNGLTLYTDSNDTAGVSNCTGTCAVNWPPYTVPASDVAKGLVGVVGINGKIGSIARADGSLQVTYNDKPLYFWIKDVNPGDTTGNGVGNFTVAKP